ncbi:membrane protein insertase YidC [Candidatus Babeliales bacterium]|nr:membrane protein insertase YidC [Candidatus Babeliales bacterium]
MNIASILLWVGLFFVGQWLIQRFSLKTKDILFIAAAAFTLNWMLSMFMGPSNPESEQQEEIITVNKEIDFADGKAQKEALTDVITSYGRFTFSSYGASLRKADFRHGNTQHPQWLATLPDLTLYEKEQSPFLIALDRETPFYYELVSHDEDELKVVLKYHGHSERGAITKLFTLHKDKHQLDLSLTIDPHGDGVQARLFFVSPYLAENSSNEQIGGIVQELHKPIMQYARSRSVRTLDDEIWKQPTLFGASSRYFATAMIHDAHNFAQRGYFKVEPERIAPILEGPVISKETTWNLSFYLGPKEQKAIAGVDKRLESLLNYGWLGFIAKPILKLLRWFNTRTHNFGWAIVLLTILFRLLLIPLSFSQQKTTSKIGNLKKKEEHIKRKYKNDPEKLQQEQMKLAQEQFGAMIGCLPSLLQMPIFFALASILRSSLALYKVPFLWIPDLSAPDPYYILPIATCLSMVLMPAPAGGGQARISALVMGLVFGAFSVSLSSGLVLYLALSTFVGVVSTLALKKLKFL